MKSILTLLIVVIILLVGCDTVSDLSVNNNPDGFYKSSRSLTLIPLPNKSPLWEDSVFTMSKEIDGTVGARMNMEKYYIAENGDSIVITANLYIPPGAFEGKETITMTVDDDNAAIHYYPSMVFKDTLHLFQSFKGLNLEEYPTGTIDFVYVYPDGSVALVKKNGVQVIVPSGIVRVQNALMTHFSRYGWVR